MMRQELMILSTRAGEKIAEAICEDRDVKLGKVKVKIFSDGEIYVQVPEVRDRDVFIICPLTADAENWDETKFIVDAAKRASAGRITLVITYLGYNRQDRKDKPRVPISAKVKMEEVSRGVDRVLLFDIHSEVTAAFFDPARVDHLYASYIAVPHLKKRLKGEKYVIASTDAGGVKRAIAHAELLSDGGDDVAIFHKRRKQANTVDQDAIRIVGDVAGRTVVFVDDMVDTAGTLVADANAAKKAGAEKIIAYATHGLLTGKAVKLIDKSPIEELIITNSIPGNDKKAKEFKNTKVTVLPLEKLAARAINRIHLGKSVSSLIL